MMFRLRSQIFRKLCSLRIMKDPKDSILPKAGLYIGEKDIVEVDEEQKLVEFSNQLFQKKRYQVDHWDDVITKYRETELNPSTLPNEIQEILSKVQDAICTIHGKKMKLKVPHLIDLHRDGFIDPHIDSIKFSGDIVAGLSLISSRIFRLTLDDKFRHLHSHNPSTPNIVEFLAHPRRLYILSDEFRYHYSHSVLLTNQTDLLDGRSYQIDRRMSVIFRDELEGQEGERSYLQNS